MTARTSVLVTVAGFALLLAGASVIYWPLGLLFAGATLLMLGLFTETKQ